MLLKSAEEQVKLGKYYLGYDIGAVSVNRAILDRDLKIISILPYLRHYGEPAKMIAEDIENLLKDSRFGRIAGLSFTGSGGKNLTGLLKASFINEIEAIITAVKSLYPEIMTVIEIGGQDSKFIDLAAGDYAMNELCAAGTGSFLDQQASRFNLNIEQFCEIALKSSSPATIAGRCSVFAKSDMIHLQQEAASDEDIMLGLCYAMARSYKSGIVKGKKFKAPIIFCGGVSYNLAMFKAFEDILKEKIIIPENQASIGAIGAALKLAAGGTDGDIDMADILAVLKESIKSFKYEKETLKPLEIIKSTLPSGTTKPYIFNRDGSDGGDSEKNSGSGGTAGENTMGGKPGKIDAFIGIDVGSISTNVVAIDSDKKLISKVYLRTAGRPIEAVRKGIEIIGKQVGDKINVRAVGTTGSGRYLIGDLVGADIIINEITAQATAAGDIDKEVDTIFEIGGQDSKYISLENGVVVDFEMNKICAAGTGSFLEEQSERFDIKIEEFGDRALTARAPLNLGERCTVFMETNVLSHYQNGASIENILAGLAYSIAINYINRVVGTKKIGNKIFFQGAVAFNKAVVAAFENYLGKKIIVPQNHEVTGAIGTAIRALENHVEHSNFRGFDVIANIKYSQSSFECGGCPNMCEIKKVTSEGSKSLFYGGRCEKYEKKNTKKADLKDLFLQRDEILLNSYAKSIKNPGTALLNSRRGEDMTIQTAQTEKEPSIHDGTPQSESASLDNSIISKIEHQNDGKQKSSPEIKEGRLKVGLPFTMLTYEFYPFWNAYFSEMGIELVLSDKTNRKIINDGLGYVVAETCFPIKVMLGHIQNLLDKGVDYVFVPSIRDMPCDSKKIEGSRTGSYPCPFVQGLSTFVKASVPIDAGKILDPIVNFSFKEFLKNDQLQKLGAKFGKSKKLINNAVKAAYRAQEVFYRDIKKAGEKVLDNLKEDDFAAVIIARPYNSCDANISMDIPGKLRDLGIQAIPLDYLSVDNVDLFSQWPNMYWEFGDRILSAVDIIKKDKRLFPVYITNFGCGPDSFIMQFFEREIDRPFLKIEVDEHTAGAGVITRCEAFYDSLSNIKKLKTGYSFKEKKTEIPNPQFKRKDNRVLYIPYMGDGAYAIQAAFQSGGIESEIMMSDYETLEIGRKHTLGKECYPYILTTGDILKTLKYNDPSKCAFLMPLTHGPCRFGQYNQMQKILLKELGYPDVPIISPGAPESSQFYKEYDMQGKKGARLLSRAMIGAFTIDYMTKYLHGTRPYEINKGETELVYNGLIEMISEKLRDPGNEKVLASMAVIMSLAEKKFSSIAVNRTPKPLIGIVGEIYVRNHPYSNNEIIKMVEHLGGQVQIPDIGEWAYHTNATSKLDNSIKQKDLYFKILGNIRSAFSFNGNGADEIIESSNGSKGNGENILNFSRGLKFNVTNRVLNKLLHRYHRLLEHPVKDTDIIDLDESDIYEIWDNAEPYIIKWFGEAALSVGKSIHWIKKGADGIINVLPFTCMPGTMVTAISKSLREEYKVPWLNLAFDGLEQGTTDTRLEAFLYQAKQHKVEKLHKEGNQHIKEKPDREKKPEKTVEIPGKILQTFEKKVEGQDKEEEILEKV